MVNISKIRNIGISAHIDSGKTTLTERILFYSNKIHKMHEVKDKNGKGATMDSMDLERERGITISSAATNVNWDDHSINIIDTPGHVDFTIEVERALRVLDGAVLVLCAVGGVQSQSITVDRQLKRYKVPRVAFINKCDRIGANPYKVTGELREKLGINPILTQIPIGLESKHEGIVDLITMKAVYFNGKNGEIIEETEIPEELCGQAESVREELIDTISMFSDDVAEAYLEGNLTQELLYTTIREATIALNVTPVFIGSAYKNKGVQPLIDGIVKYLPAPNDVEYTAHDLKNEEKEVKLYGDLSLPAVALAFKLEDGQYGRLSYVRVYQGKIKKGDDLFNTRSKKRIKVGRLIRMHSDKMEDIETAFCGDIIAFFGVDCQSGDTFTECGYEYSMTSMHVPKPVISLSIKANNGSSERMMKALQRFVQEDPTFTTYIDDESGERIICGMGELHLDVYVERMKREYNAVVETGKPQVAYRETISRESTFDYTHRKQSGGAGQYARVIGSLIPYQDTDYEFVDNIKGGVIPTEYIPACDKGFQECLKKGSLIGFPVIGVKAIINDGDFHAVDSSSMAFQTAAICAFKQAYNTAKPHVLEPIMKVTIEGPAEFQGNVFSSINQRRGIIISTTEDEYVCRVESEVPLSEMFGYSTVLRSISQGKSEFTMELSRYTKVPDSVLEKIKKELAEKKKQDLT